MTEQPTATSADAATADATWAEARRAFEAEYPDAGTAYWADLARARFDLSVADLPEGSAPEAVRDVARYCLTHFALQWAARPGGPAGPGVPTSRRGRRRPARPRAAR